MKECDILGGQNIVWPLLHIFREVKVPNPQDLLHTPALTCVCVCVCDRSLLVHLDDNFIRHFANESTFIIDIAATARDCTTSNTATPAAAADDNDNDDDVADDGDAGFDITLTEIDVYSNSTAVKQWIRDVRK